MDPRLQPEEIFHIIESEQPPRRGKRERHEPAPMTGPEIIAELMKKLVSEAGVGTGKGDGEKVQRPENDVSGILTSEGLIGRGVSQRVETLLREELKEKGKIIARESPAPPATVEETGKGDESVTKENDKVDQNGTDAETSQEQDEKDSTSREEVKSEAESHQLRAEAEEDVPMDTD